MQLFGSGVWYATPLTDVNGNAIANPTPVKAAILQDFSLDISWDEKLLYSQQQFALDMARGKGKIAGKAKFARINGKAVSSLTTGQALTSGITAIQTDSTGATIPSSPYTITPTVPNSGTWAADLGVLNAAGNPMTRVASSPATGQYSVAAGVYTFAAADTGLLVFINYRYTVSSASAGNTQTLTNPNTGNLPSFSSDLQLIRGSKVFYVRLNNCTSSKLAIASKQDDFIIPEFDISAIDDGTGNVGIISSSD